MYRFFLNECGSSRTNSREVTFRSDISARKWTAAAATGRRLHLERFVHSRLGSSKSTRLIGNAGAAGHSVDYPVYPQMPILGELTTGRNIASEQGWAFLCAAQTKGLLSISCAQQMSVAGLSQAAHVHGSGSFRTRRRTDRLPMRPSRTPVRSMVSRVVDPKS